MNVFCLLPVGCQQADDANALIQKLNHEDLIVRLSAIKTLGEIKDSIAVESLVATLGDRNCGCTAANALEKIGEPAVEPLITALKNGDIIVRRNAAKALGGIKDAGAIEPLIIALKDKSPIVRRNAAIALGQIKDSSSVEPLIAALKDEDAIVRNNAVTALGEIGKPAVEVLIVDTLD
jgi:HEAT repeat protein